MQRGNGKGKKNKKGKKPSQKPAPSQAPQVSSLIVFKSAQTWEKSHVRIGCWNISDLVTDVFHKIVIFRPSQQCNLTQDYFSTTNSMIQPLKLLEKVSFIATNTYYEFSNWCLGEIIETLVDLEQPLFEDLSEDGSMVLFDDEDFSEDKTDA